MTQIAVKKDIEAEKSLPVFGQIARRMEEVRQRAFKLFEERGKEVGHELDDWLAAEREVFGWPAAELKEKDSTYEVEVTLPGFAARDVEVTATPNELIVHAASEAQKSGKDERVVWTEFGSNDVYRCLAFPESVATDKVTAEFEDGLLRVSAPKSVTFKPSERKVPISAG